MGIMWRVYIQRHPTISRWYARMERRPSWVAQAAFLAAVLVVVVPILLLFGAAVAIGLVVFLTLALFVWIVEAVRDIWHRLTSGATGRWSSDGRRNVRVIRRR